MVKTRAITPENEGLEAEKVSFEWRFSSEPVAYVDAVQEMESRVEAIHSGYAGESIWLLEHPPVYTAGTSAAEQDLLAPDRFPVITTGRGGQYTYHGPGQRIAYVMLDLSRRKKDVRAFVCSLEDAVIATLADFGITGERRSGRVGVWVARPDKGSGREDKIAAIGVRVRRWVTFHGLSLNVYPDLEHYSGIVPCGVQEHGVTSLADLGKKVSMEELDRTLTRHLASTFDLPKLSP